MFPACIKPSQPILRRSHPLAPGLAWAFPFAAGAGSPRDVVRGFSLALNGAAAWGKGPYGPCLNLPGGTGDYAQLAADPSFDWTGRSFSIAAVFRLTDWAAAHVLANRGGASGRKLYLYIPTSGVLYNWDLFNSLTTVPAAVEHTLVYTSSATSDTAATETFHLDGTQIATRTGTVYATSTAVINFGAIPGTLGFLGTINGLWCWMDRVLNPSEAALFAADPFAMHRPRRTIVPMLTAITPPAGGTILPQSFYLSRRRRVG